MAFQRLLCDFPDAHQSELDSLCPGIIQLRIIMKQEGKKYRESLKACICICILPFPQSSLLGWHCVDCTKVTGQPLPGARGLALAGLGLIRNQVLLGEGLMIWEGAAYRS